MVRSRFGPVLTLNIADLLAALHSSSTNIDSLFMSISDRRSFTGLTNAVSAVKRFNYCSL